MRLDTMQTITSECATGTGRANLAVQNRAPNFFIPYPCRILALAALLICASHAVQPPASAQSGGGYLIRKSTIDSGGGTVAGGDYLAHGTIGQHDAAILAGGDYFLTSGFWSPVSAFAPDPVLAESSATGKVRFISFVVPDSSAGSDTALRVELTSLHQPPSPPPGTPDFTSFEGQFRYVNSFGGATLCIDSNTFGTDYRCAQLDCQPEYRDWATELASLTNPPSQAGLVHVTGDAVVPSSILNVSHIAASCGAAPAANTCASASAPLLVATSRWGDVGGGGGAHPDGSANVIDIGLVVDNVKGLVTAIPERRAWMKNPANPFANPVNVIDIGLTVDAVKGLPYPYTIAACP